MKFNVLKKYILNAGIFTLLSAIALTAFTISGPSKDHTTYAVSSVDGLPHDAPSPSEDASRFLQHVSGAEMALHMGKTKRAMQHIQYAADHLRVLQRITPEENAYSTSPVAGAKITYRLGKIRSFIFPMPVTNATLENAALPFWSYDQNFKILNIQSLPVSLQITTAWANDRIELARTYILRAKADKALAALRSVSAHSVSQAEAIPTHRTITDGLALAEYFISARNYSAAEIALHNISTIAKSLTHTAIYAGYEQELNRLQAALHDMNAALQHKDPAQADQLLSSLNYWNIIISKWDIRKTALSAG
jgi:hypothetical protein